ncbi:MAG: translocation/assembly module TamB domain-containing protein, partial [Trueperaceae bacterium]|nr:translocation/assembly module TamB domain-containing protein [Trueperaceae bacterium]
SAGRLGGEIALPAATPAGALLARVSAAGTLAAPVATVTLAGAAAGKVVATPTEGVDARLSVPAPGLVAAVPALAALGGALEQPLSVHATLAPTGVWTAEASASLEAGATTGGLLVELSGTGLDYSGRAVVEGGGAPLAAAELTGTGAALRGSLDLGEVDWPAVGAALGTDLQVTGGGLLTFATDPPSAGLTLDLTADVAGNELRLRGTAPDDLHLALAGPAGQLEGLLAWRAAAPGAAAGAAGPQARLVGTYGAVPVEVVVEAVDEAVDVATGAPDAPPGDGGGGPGAPGGTAGGVAGAATDGAAGGATGTAIGAATGGLGLRARYGAATLTARLLPTPETPGPRALTAHLDAPPGSLVAYGVAADAALALDGTDLSITALTGSVTGLLPDGAPLTLTAAGPVTGPAGTALAGTIATPAVTDAAGFELSAAAATVRWRGATLGCATDLSACDLRGTANADDLAALLAPFPTAAGAVDALAPTVTADLAWSVGGGFTGTLAAAARADVPALGEPVTLTLAARGEGRLAVHATATQPGAAAARPGAPADDALATLDLTLAADPRTDPGLSGSAALRLAAADVALLEQLGLSAHLTPAGVEPTTLTADLSVAGTLGAPTLRGTATLGGPLAASGPLSYGAAVGGAPRASLELTGPALDLALTLTGGPTVAWEADAKVTGLDLGPWLPQAPAPRLDLDLRADPRGVALDDVALTAGRSRIAGSGELTYAAGAGAAAAARLALELDADLADLGLGAGVSGTLRGPVALHARDLADPASFALSASLQAAGVGVPGVDGGLDGSLTLGGTLADPLVTATLTGTDRVRGTLSAGARPARGELTIDSDLAYGQFATDLTLGLQGGGAGASGTARYGDAVVLLADGRTTGEDGVTVTGAGRLTGWEASVSADLSEARLTGDLAALGGGLAGRLALTLGAATDAGPWLDAAVTGAAVGDVDLGAVSVTAAAPLAPLAVTGDHLSGALDVTSGSWSAAVAALEVGGGVKLDLTAAGTFAELQAVAAATGPDLDLQLNLTATAGNVVAELAGTAYGGAVTGRTERAEGPWTGALDLAGAELAGLRLSVTGTVMGEGALPQLVLSTAVEAVDGDLRVAGRATVTTAGITVDQVVSGGPTSVPLRLQGRVAPDADLSVATLASAPGASARAELPVISQVRLRAVPGLGLLAAGAVRLDVGPARLVLTGQDTTPRLSVQLVGLPQLRAVTTLEAADLLGLLTRAASEGLRFEGSDAAAGFLTVALAPTPRVTLDGFEARLAGITLSADGELSAAGANLAGAVTLATDLPLAGAAGAAAGPTEYTLPWTLTTAGAEWRLAYAGPLGRLTGTYAPGTAPDAVTLDVDLRLSGGAVTASLDHRGGRLSGSLQVDDLQLYPPGLGAVVVNATGSVADGRVGGSANLQSDAGRLAFSGSWGLADLLPPSLAVGAPRGGRLEARLRNLELADVPLVRERAPYLAGTVTGALQLRDGLVFGQFVSPELTAGGTSSAVEVAVSGALSSVDVSLRTRGATLTANLAGDRLSGSGRFERFPAQFLAHAVVGPSDVTADVTGVLRFDLPLSDPAAGYLRLATEEVRLERAGVPTVGNVTLTLDAGTVQVDRAEFAGLGRWEAAGLLRPDDLDFHLEAVDADFTPLLGLFPSLARLGMGAEGSLTIDVKGDLAQPSAVIASAGLDVEVAGSRYRLGGTRVALEGNALTVAAQLDGVSPLAGSLAVSGGARLDLAPFALGAVDVGFDGSLALPGVGVVEGVTGNLTQDADGDLALAVTGRLGEGTARLEGGLFPLDLHASGTGLSVAFPALMVASAVVDADLRLAGEAGGVALGGTITAAEVIVDPNARPPAPPEGAAAAPEPPQPALAALRFAGLAIRAPQRVLLTTNLGSGEAALDLVLSGTAAAPRLVGTASTLRGSLRFSGRDFTIDRAIATFGPSTGLYPALDVAAHTELDKSRVVAADNRVSFVTPREGQTFVVNLAFTGQVQAAPAEEGGFRFDVQPRVSSDARIEVAGDGPGSGVRAFTDAELMSLLTLGRFELNAGIIGTGGLGAAVAQGALDTAVDLLVVSELANAIRQALGLDVVEIRTSALSSLLDASEQPFGVSLRLGGYLNPDLFASYRIGTYDGPDRAYAITNEVLLSYGLGPLDLDITGRIDFPGAGVPDPPRPELGVSLSYAFSPTFALDAGVTLGTERSAFQVGVTLRW